MTTLTARVAVFDNVNGDPVYSHETTASVFTPNGRFNFVYQTSGELDFRVFEPNSESEFILFDEPVEMSMVSVFSLSFGRLSMATYLSITDDTNKREYLLEIFKVGSSVPAFPVSQSGFDSLIRSVTLVEKFNAGEDNEFSLPLNMWLGRGLTENDFLNVSQDDTSQNIDFGDGNDTFYGGGGLDTISGGAGNDRLVAGRAGSGMESQAEFFGGNGHDLLKAKGAVPSTFYGESGNDRLIGGASGDWLDGGYNDDVLIGNAGDDYLVGGNQDDALYGGRDNDLLFAGNGNDLLRGNRGNDGLNGEAGDDDLRGGGQQDELNGGAGNDYLLGGNGVDRLIGGEGDDVLVGGFGSGVDDGLRDTFVFDPAGGFDRVKDFENDIDVIDLTAFGFTDFGQLDSLAADTAAGLRLRFESGTVLFIDGFAKADFDASDVVL